jgi:MFS family permease
MTIGDLATILTVAGVSIYVLGLIGLAIPIRRVFTGELTTAWYVVSLVPKTVVAGQGVRIWLGWPIALTGLMVLIAVAAAFVLRQLPSANPAWFWLYYAAWMALGIAPLLVSFALLVITVGGAQVIRDFLGSRSITWLLGTVAPLLSALIGILIIQVATYTMVVPSILLEQWHGFSPSSPIPSVLEYVTEHPILMGIILLFVGGFLVGVPAATRVSPPLPRVQITKHPPEGRREVIPPPLQGHLVSHSDGFWHLFDVNNALLSIPDDQVLAVRIMEDAQPPPVEEEAPTEETAPQGMEQVE